MENVLGKDGNHVAFGQVEVESTDEDIGRVLVFVMPRGATQPEVEFGLVYLIDFLDDAELVSIML